MVVKIVINISTKNRSEIFPYYLAVCFENSKKRSKPIFSVLPPACFAGLVFLPAVSPSIYLLQKKDFMYQFLHVFDSSCVFSKFTYKIFQLEKSQSTKLFFLKSFENPKKPTTKFSNNCRNGSP